MGLSTERNIKELVTPVTSVLPQSSTGSTIHGASVDRLAYGNAQSCVVHHAAGAISGAPSTSSVASTIEDSADNSSFAAYGSTNPANLTAQNSEANVGVDLSGARRYIRVTTVVGFTGGTSPAALVAADLILGGQQEQPAV